jgi:hypothetical protein
MWCAEREGGDENGVQGVATFAHPPVKWDLISLSVGRAGGLFYAHLLLRNVAGEFTDDLSKFFLVIVFSHLVFT